MTVSNCTSKTNDLINDFPHTGEKVKMPFFCDITFSASAMVNLETDRQNPLGGGGGHREILYYCYTQNY